MSWEQFWENLSNIGNLSLIIIAVAALLYYFGKLIGDIKVEKYEKTDYYMQGVLFSLSYIAMPFVLIIIFTQYLNLYIPSWSLWFQIVTLYLLFLSALAQELQKKYGALSKRVLHIAVEKAEEKRRLDDVLKQENFEKFLLKLFTGLRKVLGNYHVLFIFSFFILWSYYSAVSPENILSPQSLLFSLSAFLNLTFVAINFGYVAARYPHAKIVLGNGSEIKGKVLKFEEFVHLLKEDEKKKVLINKDKIICIEENLFEENTKDNQQGEV